MNLSNRKRVFGTAAALAAAVVASELLLPPAFRRPKPSFKCYKPLHGDSEWVILCLHGHGNDGSQFDPILQDLRRLGYVLVPTNGIRPQDTAAAAVRELRLRGLVGKLVVTYGISMGTRTAIRFRRRLAKTTGIQVAGAIIESGPFNGGSVVWGHQYERYAVRILRGGPLTWAIWRLGRMPDRPISLTACGRMVTTRTPRPDEYGNAPILVLEASDDTRVKPGGWQACSSNVTVNTLFAIHADMVGPHQDRFKAISEWYTDVLMPAVYGPFDY